MWHDEDDEEMSDGALVAMDLAVNRSRQCARCFRTYDKDEGEVGGFCSIECKGGNSNDR